MDVIGLGALNYDNLYIVDKMARGGEEIPVKEIIGAPGGSAANTIVGIARMGFKTGFIGRVGDDEEGRIILEDLEKEGVDLKGIIKSKGKTGIITGFVDSQGERALYPYPGVNDSLNFHDIDLDYIKKTKILHMSSFVSDIPFEAQRNLVRVLKDTKISFAPGMLCGKKKFSALKPIIEKSYVFFGNEREVRMLTGKGYMEGSKLLLKEGVNIVAITLDKEGSYVSSRYESHIVEAYKERAVDTTGAGDAFAAGFLTGLLLEEDLEKCGKIGNKLASLCIKEFGARKGLPYKDVLKEI